MSRGIQPGTTAQSEESKEIDAVVRKGSEQAFMYAHTTNPNIFHQTKLTKLQIPGNIGACEPDGGIWFYKDVPIMAVEAKNQKDRGNAIDRWFKNHFILRSINSDISYITFASGLGVLPNNPIWNTLHIAHLDGFNALHPYRNTAFLNVEGFNWREVYGHLIDIFNIIIERYES